ncbi:hypothetical protein BW723_15910 [Polaribacter reichenbachii]|nr:hypothetical protein BW723_15910 [Polaribacter reichenbachii]
MLGSSLLTKILTDFLFGFYLLNYVLNHATNHIQTRWQTFKKTMEKPVFDLLVEISKNKYFDYEDKSRTTNRDKEIERSEKYRQLRYLLDQGFISSTKDIYIITEYGYIVSQFESWSEYINHQKELLDRKVKKENLDLKISDFQVRTKYLPYIISLLSVVLSIIALSYQFKKENKTEEQISNPTLLTSEKQVKNSINNGIWISTKDSLSSVEINGNNWTFKYVNEKTDLDDHYEYLITKSVLDKHNEIIDGSLILTNKSDTLKYGIDYISEKNMTLIYLPRGNFHHYERKE